LSSSRILRFMFDLSLEFGMLLFYLEARLLKLLLPLP
jgi:hypothetical protein